MPKQGEKAQSRQEKRARSDFLREVGARLKYAREATGKHQKEVAEALGVDQGLISKIESGQSGMNLYLFVKLCDEIGASSDEVLGLEDSNG